MKLTSKLGWIAAAALGLFVVATFAGIVSAGPLDPTAPPASTQRTQNDLIPAWHQTLSATGGCNSERFDCVMTGDAAVLDRETGLLWERAPSPTTGTFVISSYLCAGLSNGGRMGWRLPTQPELHSLIISGQGLPAGHPFTATAGGYWTTTTFVADATAVLTIDIANGTLASGSKDSFTARRWCVRGSNGFDTY